MASGVKVADDCITTYQDLKLSRKFKYILFTLNESDTTIVVDKTSSTADYEDFVKELPEDQCRWAVYDFEFEKEGEGKRSKIGFILWSPDAAKIKEKMVFAASREALRQKLDGIAFEVQSTDLSEISHRTVFDKALTSTH